MPDNDKLITLDNLGTFKDNIEEEIREGSLNTPEVIILSSTSGTLDSETLNKLKAHPAHYILSINGGDVYSFVLDSGGVLQYDCKLITGSFLKTRYIVITKETGAWSTGETEPNVVEVVEYQTTTPLTAAQVTKAQAGKLAVLDDNRIFVLFSKDSTTVTFAAYTVSYQNGYYSQACYTLVQQRRVLTISSRMFTQASFAEYRMVADIVEDFIGNTDTPNASGKQVVRALNLRKTQDMIANVYDATATYSVGDYCIYQNDLYVCNTAISTAESWTAAHWTKTNVMDEGVEVIELSGNSGTLDAGTLDKILRTPQKVMFKKSGEASVYHYTGSNLVWTCVVANASSRYFEVLSITQSTGVYYFSSYVDTPSNKQDALVWNPTVPSGKTPIQLTGIKDGNNYYEISGGSNLDIGYPAYDATATYALGDVVIYDDKIYQCISAISTAEAWDSTHWQQVAVDINNIVTITSTGVQTDEMAAKILNAKALYYDHKLFSKSVENSAEIQFYHQVQETSRDIQYYLVYGKTNKSIAYSTYSRNRVASIGGQHGQITVDSSFEVTSEKVAKLTGKLPYLTTAPTEDNTSGFLTIVVLSAEPDTRYSGYMYVITGSNS